MAEIPALSSAGVNSEKKHDEPVLLLNPSLEDRVPEITANESTNQAITARRAVVLKGIENEPNRPSSFDSDQTNLEWQTFDGSLPNGAVSIYNGYVGRIDYVAKYRSEAGFYNPDKGPHCRYPYGEKEHLGSPFEILVNKDNFEVLEWKAGSYDSVPPNSVKTCSSKDVFVGKNKYGLGKVHVKHQAFFLPWEGYEYWYKTYQVLTFNKDVISEHISDVKYKTDGVKIIEYFPENMDKYTIDNSSCQLVTGTATLSKMKQVQQSWNTSFSITLGVKTTITAGIPLIFAGGIEFSAQTTLGFTKGTTHVESKTHSLAVDYNVPPNHSCSVNMVGYKYGADIPYTARISRTYRNGETTWTSITGTYNSIKVSEVRAVVGPCRRLSNTPCPK